ncbi:MAG: hypothetical protein JJE47_05745 [Acidimicrobiia bacterium]|nr:hypothetical protein [Acidimicrobiia bacterium]
MQEHWGPGKGRTHRDRLPGVRLDNLPGGGMIDIGAAAGWTAEGDPTQNFAPATGTGSLEAARGTDHLENAGIVLNGEMDIFGMAFDGSTWSDSTWSGSTWSGGVWNGSTWSTAPGQGVPGQGLHGPEAPGRVRRGQDPRGQMPTGPALPGHAAPGRRVDGLAIPGRVQTGQDSLGITASDTLSRAHTTKNGGGP